MRTFTLIPATIAADIILETQDTPADLILVKSSPSQIAISNNSSVTTTNGQGFLMPMDQPVRIVVPPRTKIYAVADVGGQVLSVILAELSPT